MNSMIQKNGFVHFDDWPNVDIPVDPFCLHFFFLHGMIENNKLKLILDFFVHEGEFAIIQEKSR